MNPYRKRSRTPDEERLCWLLDFMQRDLTALRPGEQLDLLDDCVRLLEMRDPAVGVLPPDGYAFALAKRKLPWPDALVVEVQTKLNAGVKRLEAGKSWQPFDDALNPVFHVQADKTVARRYDGKYEVVMLASAVDLLVTFWPLIRRCELTSCRRLFLLEDGRQRFHDPQCAKLARLEKPPEERKPRNYVQEAENAAYSDRLKKKQQVGSKKEKKR